MSEQISAEASPSAPLPEDGLGHERLAHSFLNHAQSSRPGTVIAIQGSWGRGKTDVLRRIQNLLAGEGGEGFVPEPVWLNPWQYGTADLLTPMVLQIISRIPPTRLSGAATLRKTAESLLRAGVAIGFKAASLVAPGGGLFEAAAQPVDDLLKGLFEGEKKVSEPERDPVAAMAQRFHELVEEFLNMNEKPYDRLVICIDDLDRCLPDRQVSMLEAIHFLSSADAKAVFFVAIDPTLAKQAILTHYGSEQFDPDLYLDKLFDLRVNLPSLSHEDIKDLIRANFELVVSVGKRSQLLRNSIDPILGDSMTLEIVAADVFSHPGVENPRIIRRVFHRLHLLTCQGATAKSMGIVTPQELKYLLLWLVVIERWPVLRSILQSVPEELYSDFFRRIVLFYRKDKINKPDDELPRFVKSRLYAPELAPEFTNLFRTGAVDVDAAPYFRKFDEQLVKVAL